MSDALQLRRKTSRAQRLRLAEIEQGTLQIIRQELLECLAIVTALAFPDIGNLVGDYVISPTTTVLVSGLGYDEYSQGTIHIAQLVQQLHDKILAWDKACTLPVFRYTCNGHDIAVRLQLNPDLRLADLSRGEDVTRLVRQLRHTPLLFDHRAHPRGY